MAQTPDEPNLDDSVWDRLWELWKLLGCPDPPEIPKEALISEGIPLEDYEE